MCVFKVSSDQVSVCVCVCYPSGVSVRARVTPITPVHGLTLLLPLLVV